MNRAEVVRRLYRELQSWPDHTSPEMHWTRRGVARSLEIVKRLADEESKRNRIVRPRLSHYLSTDLYLAIKAALAYLKRGDRARGIARLEQAIEAVLGVNHVSGRAKNRL